MRGFRCLLAGGLASMVVAAAGPATVLDKVPDESNGMALEQTVNWTDGVVDAMGVGPRQMQVPPALRFVTQRRVAITDAYRNLAETKDGVHVTSNTTVKMFELQDDLIQTSVNALLKGFRVVSEGFLGDNETYQVTLRIPLGSATADQASVASIVLPTLTPEKEKQVLEDPKAKEAAPPVPADEPIIDQKPPEKPVEVNPLPQRKPGPYTGLVVDCREYDVERCMSPHIVRQDGSEVWGTVQVAPNVVIGSGIVAYLPTLDYALDPQASRAGKNPLVIRATGRHGSFKANAVVSDADAALILSENQGPKFLDKLQVVFVVNSD